MATAEMADPAAKPDKIEGRFDDTPKGWAAYWTAEFKASRDEGSEEWTGIKRFQERGAKIVRRYRNQRKGNKKANDARINIFPANIQTQRAILVGNTPKCEVARAHGDPEDDVARVAAEILKRILNQGLEEESKGFASTISRCTEDRLLPGMCGSRVQFAADFQPVPEKPAINGPCQACMGAGSMPSMAPEAPPDACPTCQGSGQVELAPAVPADEKPVNERADASYVHWRDQLWSASRTWEEVRWWAFGADMGKKQWEECFPDTQWAAVPKLGKAKADKNDGRTETPWSRVRVWEIWSKEHQRVFWFVEGFNQTLQHADNQDGADPLGLDEFWPMPPPMMANAVSDAYLPTADFDYAEDLYNEADDLTTRIRGIVRAIKVAGAYDKANGALRRLLDEACELELIPVENWSQFMAKGGVSGAFQLLPIQEMVATVETLVSQRNLVIEGIYQITGLGDIIRGQQSQSETATTSAIKARFASVRLQDLQKEVARYATDLQRIRKEVIAKHFSIETIIERSSIMQSPDGQDPALVMKAAQLIKDRHLDFRVTIKPEQISLQDWTVLKQQRSDVLTSLGGYFQSMMPFLQLCSQAGPQGIQAGLKLTLRNAQWLVSGMPGASGVESSFDAFVREVEQLAEQAASQPPAPPKPDPKVQAQALKNQGEMQKQQAHTQGRMIEIAAETRADMAQRTHDAQMDIATHAATSEAQMRLDALKQVDAVTGAQR